MTLVWSPRALRNLLAVVDYIGRDSPERARAYAAKIRSKAETLRRFPSLGRVVPEMSGNPHPPRELLIDDYRLVYRIRRKKVEIVTLFHGMRLFPPLD